MSLPLLCPHTDVALPCPCPQSGAKEPSAKVPPPSYSLRLHHSFKPHMGQALAWERKGGAILGRAVFFQVVTADVISREHLCFQKIGTSRVLPVPGYSVSLEDLLIHRTKACAHPLHILGTAWVGHLYPRAAACLARQPGIPSLSPCPKPWGRCL